MKLRSSMGLAASFVASALTAIAAAQDGPPTPKLSTVQSPIIGYAIIAILAGAIISISLYSSKREREDL